MEKRIIKWVKIRNILTRLFIFSVIMTLLCIGAVHSGEVDAREQGNVAITEGK